jgi:hypothetical protein
MMLFFALKATDIVVHAYCLDIFIIAAPLVQKDLQKDSHATYSFVCWLLSSYHNISLKS